MTIKDNKQEILWNIVNSLLAGSLVFLGSLTVGEGITWQGLLSAFVTCMIVAITKFQNYWIGEQKEYSTKLFKFL